VRELSEKAFPGTVIALRPLPLIATGKGALQLEEIQLQSKKRCRADSLVNGSRLTLGEILGE
jgi:methionyl-tRNA formyltransferase